MRRAIARGRVFPQKFSTDRRIGRLSLKAVALFPLIWVNADDQGRLSGDPEEIKYAVCPNIDHITKQDVPEILKELVDNKLILHYNTSKTYAVQMLDWWDECKLQWAWPSDYSPPDGWEDRLRYKSDSKTVFTKNWMSQVNSQVSDHSFSGEVSGESPQTFPLTTPSEKEKGEEIGMRMRKGRGRGNSPECSGEKTPSPTLTGEPLLKFLTDTFPRAFGRNPDSRESAQLRDIGAEISSAGGATGEQIHDAFKEAAIHNKQSISYIRAVLFDWLSIDRGPPA